MDVLAILAAREIENLRIVESVTGLIEYQTPHLEALGVYAEYKAIHFAYTQLAGIETSQEALKRALFIQWFCLTEPPFLSGIGDIDRQAELAVLTQLEHLLGNSQIDAELTAMLSYYSTWEYVFQRPEFLHLAALQAFVEIHVAVDTSSVSQLTQINEMAGRGQMGTYWQSLGSSNVL